VRLGVLWLQAQQFSEPRLGVFELTAGFCDACQTRKSADLQLSLSLAGPVICLDELLPTFVLNMRVAESPLAKRQVAENQVRLGIRRMLGRRLLQGRATTVGLVVREKHVGEHDFGRRQLGVRCAGFLKTSQCPWHIALAKRGQSLAELRRLNGRHVAFRRTCRQIWVQRANGRRSQGRPAGHDAANDDKRRREMPARSHDGQSQLVLRSFSWPPATVMKSSV
jgi:hypothetical protein